MKTAAADFVIFGGGIAGLWLLSRLRSLGLSAILFESNALGGGQTHKSQGIIHGGMKYALQGMMTNEASSMFTIPTRWRACLQGSGEIDLAQVPVLSDEQHLWSPSRLAGKITGFLASTTLNSKVGRLAKNDYPRVFQHPSFKGEVYALDEMVVDVPTLVRELVKLNQDAVYKIEPINEEALAFDENGKLLNATVYVAGMPICVSAQQFIFAAGAGNEAIIHKMKPEVAMQRRPLHMVLVKTPFDFPLYAHCLGIGPRPRMTITTHYTNDGAPVWYLGGQIAEDGIKRSSEAQIQATRAELKTLFPWLDFSRAEFSTLMVDRAEPLQKNGLKPESSFVKTLHNFAVVWPTKLALAPKLADEVIEITQAKTLLPQLFDIRELRTCPMPPLAAPIWESAFCKHAM